MKKRSKLFRRLVYLIIVVSVSLVMGTAFYSIFTIKVVETNATPKQMNYFPDLSQTMIFLIDEDIIRRHFLSDPTIDSVSVDPKYPNTLTITLHKRKELGIIYTKQGVFKIDSQGYLFDSAASNSGRPIIHLESSDLSVGNNITHSVMKTAIESAYIAKEKGVFVVDIYEAGNDSVRMVLHSGISIIIGSNRSAEDIVSSLQTILKTITIEAKTVKEIDFRFEKPFISI